MYPAPLKESVPFSAWIRIVFCPEIRYGAMLKVASADWA